MLERRLDAVEVAVKRRVDHQRDEHHQWVNDRVRQVEEGLALDPIRQLAPQDFGEQLATRLHRALSPAVSLLLEADHLRRQFGRGGVLREVDELPPLHLAAVAEAQGVREGAALPPAANLYRLAPPHPGRAVEVHEPPGAVAGGML